MTREGAGGAAGSPAPVRLAVVGAGMIAQVHRRAALLAGATVVGVTASTPARTAEVAAEWGVEPLVDLAAVLASDADVVHVCTPNTTHATYTLQLLEAGKHVVCEKPLGVSLAEAEAMAEAAEAAGVVATVPFVYRYHPLVREVRERRILGQFGTWNLLHGSYLQDWLLDPASSSWRVDPSAGGASRAFADIGSHWVDLVEWVSGESVAELVAATSIAHDTRPVPSGPSFVARGGSGAPGIPVTTEDSAVLLLRTRRGVLGSVTLSQVAAGRKNRLWFELDGSDGSAVFDQENPESLWLGSEDGAQVVVRDPSRGSTEQRRLSTLPAGHAQGYAQCFEAFVADTYAAVRGEKPEGLPTFADGVRSAQLVDAVLTSARERAWTQV